MSLAKGRVLVIDGNNYLCRAFFATKGKMTAPNGMRTNAIKGFINIIVADAFVVKPTHLCVVFDKSGENWRSEIYPEYKMNRKAPKKATTPKALARQKQSIEDRKAMREQEPWLKKLLRAMGIRVLCRAGVEGDDFMGTLAVELEADGYEVILASNDKDLTQVVRTGVAGSIKVMIPSREILNPRGVKKMYGVMPDQIVDYLSLMGDGVDNIPGINGIGPGKSRDLLVKYKSIPGIFKNLDKLTPAMRKNFEGTKKILKRNRVLITLKTDEAHAVKKYELRFPNKAYDKKAVAKVCKTLGMKSTLTSLSRSHKAWVARASSRKS